MSKYKQKWSRLNRTVENEQKSTRMNKSEQKCTNNE